MQLLERDGLEGVSFRKIATELDVSAPTLCWHVDNKRRLLDLMAEALMARAQRRRAGHSPARRAVGHLARARTPVDVQTLISHRDAPLVAAGNRPTSASLPGIEASLRTLIVAGFEPGEAFETILAIGCLRDRLRGRVAGGGRAGSARTPSTGQRAARRIRSGRYPDLVRGVHPARRAPAAPPQPARRDVRARAGDDPGRPASTPRCPRDHDRQLAANAASRLPVPYDASGCRPR